MKVIAIIIVILGFYGCSKSSSGSGGTSPTHWIINGTTYDGASTSFNDTTGLGILTTAAIGGNSLSVIFYYHPNAGGAYNVTNGGIAGGNDCFVQIGIYKGGKYDIYTTTGKAGDIVNVSVTGGKYTASFSNITLTDNTTTTTATGTVVQP